MAIHIHHNTSTSSHPLTVWCVSSQSENPVWWLQCHSEVLLVGLVVFSLPMTHLQLHPWSPQHQPVCFKLDGLYCPLPCRRHQQARRILFTYPYYLLLVSNWSERSACAAVGRCSGTCPLFLRFCASHSPLPAQPAPKTNDRHVTLVIKIVS